MVAKTEAKYPIITLSPVCWESDMAGLFSASRVLSAPLRLNIIEHAYWLQAGYISRSTATNLARLTQQDLLASYPPGCLSENVLTLMQLVAN